MNYFAHALPFLDRPYFVAGDGGARLARGGRSPLRLRRKHAEPLAHRPIPPAAVAGGLLQHLRATGGSTPPGPLPNARWSWPPRPGGCWATTPVAPAWLLGHLLVEVLLDASLASAISRAGGIYYRALDAVNALVVQQAVNLMAPRPTERLAAMIDGFRREPIVWDYLDDDRLLMRLGQVMHRLGFPPLPRRLRRTATLARQLIDHRREELLSGIPA